MNRGERRTPVVTGVGLVTPVGVTREETWSRLCSGESGLSEPSRIDPEHQSQYSVYVTGEVDGFEPARHDEIDRNAMGRYTEFAVGATKQALRDANLDPDGDAWDADRTGVSVSSAFGGLEELLEEHDGERTAVSPYLATKTLANLASGHVSIAVNARGPNRAPTTACAAGTHAVDVAVTDLVRGRADVMLVGGTESVVDYYGTAMTAAPRAYTDRRGADAVRPFDAERDGLALGEGAAVLVVETEEYARRRGADPYARITGAGATADGHHPVSPPDEGRGLRRAMEMALEEADVSSDEVDFVNAHGTGTVAGDRAEARAIERVVGVETPITSLKGTIGHTYGAAGAIDAAASVLTLRDDRIPPTANFRSSESSIEVPVVAEARDETVNVALSNSAGFGGTNGALVLEKYE